MSCHFAYVSSSCLSLLLCALRAVPDYLDVIKEPMDLSTIDKRIRQDHYKSKQMLYNDLMLVVNNCKLYNEETSLYVQCAVSLEKMLATLFPDIASSSKG
jgi:histone acetyltransferase